MTMTLEQVRDELAEWHLRGSGFLQVSRAWEFIAAIDAHLARGERDGEVVGDDLVGEVVSDICELTKADPDDPNTVCVNVDSLIVSITQTLTAAGVTHPAPSQPVATAGDGVTEAAVSRACELFDPIGWEHTGGDSRADFRESMRRVLEDAASPSAPRVGVPEASPEVDTHETSYRAGWDDARRNSVLDAPARVGSTTFGVGVNWSSVVSCAQRAYAHKDAPKPTAEQIAEFNRLLQSDVRPVKRDVYRKGGKS